MRAPVQPVAVVGVGNPDRGDDGAGPAAAHLVAAARLADVLVLTGADPLAMMDAAAGSRELHVVDACRSGAEPGTVHRIDAAVGPIPAGWSSHSSHGLGIAEALELTRSLTGLPPIVRIYAIEAGDCALGAGLSRPVRMAVERVARELTVALGSAAAAGR